MMGKVKYGRTIEAVARIFVRENSMTLQAEVTDQNTGIKHGYSEHLLPCDNIEQHMVEFVDKTKAELISCLSDGDKYDLDLVCFEFKVVYSV